MGRKSANEIAGGFGVLASVVLTMLGAPRDLHAQSDRASVSTRIDACVPIDRDRFHRLLKIELGAMIEYLDPTDPAQSLATVSLTCVPGGIQLELEDAVTRKSTRRVIAIDHVAVQSRSRLMALTVAEFVFASWLELKLPKQAVLEPEGPTPVAVERSAAAVVEERVVATGAPETRWQLSAALEALAFTSALHLIPCVALRISHALSRSAALVIAVQVGRASLPGTLADGQPASVELTTTSLLAGVAYTGAVGDFDLYAGGGARLGFAYVIGARPVAQTGSTQLEPYRSYAPWGGGAVLLGAVYRAGAHARVALGIEVGFIALALETLATADPETERAPAPPVMQLKGAWGAASLGFGWGF